jgi:hypothetical protein
MRRRRSIPLPGFPRPNRLPAFTPPPGNHYLADNRQFADILPALPQKTQSHAYFSNVAAFVDYCEKTPNEFWASSYSPDSRSSFTGYTTLESAIKLARDGWQSGADRAAEIARNIRITAPHKRRMQGRGMAGAFPHVPRYLAGDPEHMIRPMNVSASPVVTLVSNMSGNWHVSADAFINRAAVIAAIVDAIESAGFQTNVIAVATTKAHDSSFAFECAVSIKEPGEALDITRLAFASGHVAMFRHMVFKTIAANAINSTLGSSFGTTTDYPDSDIPRGTYLLPQDLTRFATPESAATTGLQFFVDALVKQGCPAFADHAESNAA